MFTTSAPKHAQLASRLRQQIASGELRPGQRLPGQVRLAQENDFSPGTVRRALSTLIQEGVLQPRHRSGVYVQTKPRQKIIGVMVPNVINPDHARLVEALSGNAAESGYSPVLFCANRDSGNYRDARHPQFGFFERLAGMHATGIVACPTHVPDEPALRARMRELDIPYVIANDYWNDCRRDNHVCADQEEAVRMAVEHLASLGHRRILMWMEPGDEWPAAITAFREETTARGLPEGNVTLASEPAGWIASLVAANGPERPTAVLVPYYEYACHALAALTSAGLRVSQDVSLVCLGGLATLKVNDVDFTATISPIEEIAERAMGLLIGGDGKATCHYLCKPALRLGATTGPVARL